MTLKLRAKKWFCYAIYIPLIWILQQGWIYLCAIPKTWNYFRWDTKGSWQDLKGMYRWAYNYKESKDD